MKMVNIYLDIAINLEERGNHISADYALKRAIEIESQIKHVL